MLEVFIFDKDSIRLTSNLSHIILDGCMLPEVSAVTASALMSRREVQLRAV